MGENSQAMRKTIYTCDKCHEEMPDENLYSLTITLTNKPNPITFETNDTYEGFDICLQCLGDWTQKVFFGNKCFNREWLKDLKTG